MKHLYRRYRRWIMMETSRVGFEMRFDTLWKLSLCLLLGLGLHLVLFLTARWGADSPPHAQGSLAVQPPLATVAARN